MFQLLRDKDPHYKFCYACALTGYSLIAFTYLFRERLSGLSDGLDFSLGVMPHLAGSFATSFILLILLSNRLDQGRLMHNGPLFVGINLFTFAGALLFEYLHLWLNLGGFHLPDVLASIAGFLLAVLMFLLSNRNRGRDVALAH